MAMTLSDMKAGMSDKVAQQVVDIFLRESEILQLLQFAEVSDFYRDIPCAEQ